MDSIFSWLILGGLVIYGSVLFLKAILAELEAKQVASELAWQLQEPEWRGGI